MKFIRQFLTPPGWSEGWVVVALAACLAMIAAASVRATVSVVCIGLILAYALWRASAD